MYVTSNPIKNSDRKECEARYKKSSYRTATKCKIECFFDPRFCSFRNTYVASYRNKHTYKPGKHGSKSSDNKSDCGSPVNKKTKRNGNNNTHNCNHFVLTRKIGACTLTNGDRNCNHFFVPLLFPQHMYDQDRSVGKGCRGGNQRKEKYIHGRYS